MNIFDDEARKKARDAVTKVSSCTVIDCSFCQLIADAALTAAVKSMADRGLANSGRAWICDRNERIMADTLGYDPENEYEWPATIIKHEAPK